MLRDEGVIGAAEEDEGNERSGECRNGKEEQAEGVKVHRDLYLVLGESQRLSPSWRPHLQLFLSLTQRKDESAPWPQHDAVPCHS